jgi:hypothetical protein
VDITRRIRSESGSALILALLALLLMSVLGMAMVSLGTTETTIAGNWRSYSTAFYGAEAGVESAIVGLRTLLASTSSPTAAQLNAITPPSLTNSQIAFVTTSCSGSNPCYGVTQPVPQYQASMPAGPYSGLSGTVTTFLIVSPVTAANGTRSTQSQNFNYTQIPLFQFAVFYGKGVDLEISPGANMTLNGKVFANSNIYLSPQNSTLQIGSVTGSPTLLATAGNIYRTIKRDGTEGFGNNPMIKDINGNYQTLNFDHAQNQNFGSNWSASQWKDAATTLFGGTVKDSAMGVNQIIPPIPAMFYNPSNPDQIAHQMIELPKAGDAADLASAKMYAQAGLRIVDGVATDGNGNGVTIPSGVISTKTFFDQREGNTMRVTEIDIGALQSKAPSWFQPGGLLYDNKGVLYVANSSGGPTSTCPAGTRGSGNPCPAVRLVNGSSLPARGLTIVSQNPVYIKGDYNTALTGDSSLTGPNSHPPAAVMADAVTVLSNNWTDANSTAAMTGRTPSNTTVNAAIATGPSQESVSGTGNGQLENDIRFLENWSGYTFTYSGSLVDLWHSEQVTAPWQNTGVYYNAPTRVWSYDTLFNKATPPGTPKGVVMYRGQWTQK